MPGASPPQPLPLGSQDSSTVGQPRISTAISIRDGFELIGSFDLMDAGGIPLAR